MLGGGVDAATLVAALGAGPPQRTRAAENGSQVSVLYIISYLG